MPLLRTCLEFPNLDSISDSPFSHSARIDLLRAEGLDHRGDRLLKLLMARQKDAKRFDVYNRLQRRARFFLSLKPVAWFLIYITK